VFDSKFSPVIKGKAFKFGDHINTDYIISGRYKFKTLDMNELARHVMEDIRPGFYEEISPGDVIVAGKNFGMGSSREQAPLALKYARIGAVVAKSFARIFYRNAINVGLPVIVLPEADEIEEGDQLLIDLKEGKVENLTKGKAYTFPPIPEFMMKILEDGGLAEHIRKHGGFAIV